MRLAKRFNKRVFSDEYYRFSKLNKEKEKTAKLIERKILDLGIGDPNTSPSQKVKEELIAALDNDENHGYSDNGLLEFRYAVSNYLGIDYKCLTHTMGIKSALVILALMFIDKNDYLIISSPAYAVLENMCKWLKGRVYHLPLKEENDFEIEFKKIPKSVLRKTKLMYLNYPNNPTMKLASKELYLEAFNLARKYNFMVINDNAYGDLVFDINDEVDFKKIEGFKDYGIELNSFSKGYNMTGYRIGYIVSNEKVIKAFMNVKDNLDSGQFIPIQLAALKALKDEDFLNKNKEKYYRRQKRLHILLTKYGFNYELPKAGFFAYVKIPKYIDDIYMSSAYKCSSYLLKHYSIMSIPYDEYGSYLRFSLTFKDDEDTFFKELEKRLKEMKIEF